MREDESDDNQLPGVIRGKGFSTLYSLCMQHLRQRVDAFLRRSKRCGFCPPEVADYDQLLEEADDQLFLHSGYTA